MVHEKPLPKPEQLLRHIGMLRLPNNQRMIITEIILWDVGGHRRLSKCDYIWRENHRRRHPRKWGVFKVGLHESIASIESCASLEELKTRLHNIIQNYGFSGFAFIDAGRPELDIPFYDGTFPPSWERAYIQNDFVHVDPALAKVRRTNTPFTWSSLKLPKSTGRKRPPAVRMMDAAHEFGFKEGLVVPFHYRDTLGALHSTSTVFFWQDRKLGFEKLFLCHREELHLIMIYWVQRAIDIVREQRGFAKQFSITPSSTPISLTGRERDVMAWAARGKTVSDTAEILHISSDTVEGFIKQALRKLNASNKTHAVAKCVALGLVDI